MNLVEGGLSLAQIRAVWAGLGSGDVAAVGGECAKVIVASKVSASHRASLGLELLSGEGSGDDELARVVAESVREELEDPPERFRDPVSYALMDDPVVIETGHVFDRSTVFDARGELRFVECPMSRRAIAASAYPVVFLKKELIEHKQRRFDALIAAVRAVESGKSRRALLAAARELLRRLGSGIYIHRAAAYWKLRLESTETNDDKVEVLRELAAEEKVGALGASVPLREVFDGVSRELVDAGVITASARVAMLAVHDSLAVDELVTMLESATLDGETDSVKALAMAGVRADLLDEDRRTALFVCAQKGLDGVVRALIEAGADINQSDRYGWTPLFVAAREGHEAVARALMEAGVHLEHAKNDD